MKVKYTNGVIAEFSKPQHGFDPVRIEYNNPTRMYQEKQEYFLHFELQGSQYTYCERFGIHKHFSSDDTMYRWRRYFMSNTVSSYSPRICEVIRALETYNRTQSVTDFDYFFQPSKESGLGYEIVASN
jgi:hypothetical protein